MRLITLLVVLFAATSFSYAQSPIDGYADLIHDLIAGDYHAAEVHCAEIEQAYPSHPAALLARACVLGTHLVDLSGSGGDEEFMSLMQKCANRCEALKFKPSEDQANLAFLKGGSYFGRGLVLCRQGNPLKGLNLILKGRAEFDEAIRLKPDFYDAYLGRGAYRYGAAMYLSTVDVLHIMVSEKAALQDLWLAADSSSFCRDLAVVALAWMYLQKDNFHTADSLCVEGLQRYPQARTFLWPVLVLHTKREQWQEAEQTALLLLQQYNSIPEDNGYEAVGLYQQLVRFADAMGHPQDAEAYARQGLATRTSKEVAKRRKDILAQLADRIKQ
jgi:tetratricopeptide (TPR) repeat protein